MVGAKAFHGGTGTRADAQRDRILCAALRCFAGHGFHAASMASLAEAAQMSTGLIYRYFENKNAIVLAIVERQLHEKRELIRQLRSSQQLVDGLMDAFEQWSQCAVDAVSVPLMLEMSAEGTRNPQIAEALSRSDETTFSEFVAWLERGRDEGGFGFAPDAARTRALELRLLVDGLALRAAREPGLDRTQLRAALEDAVRRLLA
jgi:AcrR family transcriptional regulator